MSQTHELTLQKTLRCRPEDAYRCWTTPHLLKRFFAPAPGKTVAAVIDPVPGGRFYTEMVFEEFGTIAGEGCILHIVPGRRLVWTDALSAGWRPNAQGFFTADLTFTPKGADRCEYRVIARHADPEAAQKHLSMGFESGWGQVTEQLEKVAADL